MIITFCGHSDFVKTKEYEQKLLDILEERAGNNSTEMYLGGYGNFDSFAYECCKKYKETHPNTALVFVTPYMTLEYQKNHLEYQKTLYDNIIYPNIEDKPMRFAISYRNKYIIEKADIVISCITHQYGGAYTTYKYAKKLCKEIFNIAIS